MANVTIFTSGRMINYQLSDADGSTIDRALLEGGHVTLRLDGGECRAQIVGDVDLIDLPAGWRWWAGGEAIRVYPNQWTGQAGPEGDGYCWDLADPDDSGMATSTAATLAEAIAECDAEWQGHVAGDGADPTP